MRVIVAGESAGIGRVRIRDRRCAIRSDDVGVEIDEALAGDGSAGASHAVSGVASGARETIVEMTGMLGEAGIRHDLSEAVALPAESVRPVDAEIRVGEKIGDQLAGCRGLAEFVTALEDVRPL